MSRFDAIFSNAWPAMMSCILQHLQPVVMQLYLTLKGTNMNFY